MKKTLAAVIISSFFVSGASYAANIYKGEDGSEVNVYGRLGYNITDKGADNNDTNGEFDARIGLGGSQPINDQFSVIGWGEYQVGAAEAENSGDDSLSPRYVWAGIDGKEMGKVTGGRVASGLIMFTDISDVFALSDIAAARQVNRVDGTAVQVFRQDATLQYQNSVNGLDFSVAYIFGNNDENSFNQVLDYGMNAAVRYTLDLGEGGSLAPVLAYQYNEDKGGNEYNFWGIGATYKIAAFTLGAEYSEDELDTGAPNKSKDEVWEVVAIYDLNDDWTLRGGYRSLENTDGDNLELKDTTLEAQYHLTSRSSLFASYVFRDGDNGTNGGADFGDAEEDFYQLGIRYEF
ncbi:porin [Photobacterium galatheae]|uniref:Membrane protein n=1 Tax=Photobacterium galatheae TaxID=1654360 RepID=A0A066RXZ6_9GAMM|nr:porin [Photobacterium galatheae]KDM92567.1 membrane protein [Photobacterium galatheae]MCM0147612.1 porin [Photobacterium galatheae]